MTTFIDGPAKGKTLMLKRTPKYLRVVVGKEIDALDQPDDTPRADERVIAYVLHEHKGTVHLNMGRGRGGFYAVAEYKLIASQPSDPVLREASAWRTWVEATEAESVQ